jgi:hypothetical protein
VLKLQHTMPNNLLDTLPRPEHRKNRLATTEA